METRPSPSPRSLWEERTRAISRKRILANIALQPDSSCTVTVTFTPTTAGADNAGGSPQTVSLSGSGRDFAIAVTPANGVSVSPGQQATYTVTLTPVGSFSQAVAVTCADAPQLTTCSLSSNGSVTLNGTSPSSLTMTVATTAPSATGPGIQRRQPPVNLHGSPLLWLAGFSLAAMAWNLRKRRPWLILAVAMFSIMMWASCAGGSGSSPTTPGTAAGTYSLSVSAAFAGLSHGATASLTVQ